MMIRNIAISVALGALLAGCGSSSSDSGSGEAAAATTASTPAPAPTPTSSINSTKPCVDGNFAFRTDADGKTHFTARFLPNGTIAYNLSGAPTGNWSLNGSNITFDLRGHPNDFKLTFRVTRQASDCDVQQFRGSSPGGASMTVSKI